MSKFVQETHNQYQRDYFDKVDRSRIALTVSPYVLAHLDRVIQHGELDRQEEILEVGSGLGKFTLPLASNGYRITANDLSPVLLNELKSASNGAISTICCDVAEIAAHSKEHFNRIVGFFVLHHLIDFDRVFTALYSVLNPGGKLAFCEPVAWNPLYYAQILLTPSMSFAGERSITAMQPRIILPAMRRAGFVDAASHRYGYFPPILKNRSWGNKLERWFDRRSWVPFPHAFQILSAKRPA